MTLSIPKSWALGGVILAAATLGVYQWNVEAEPVDLVQRQIVRMISAAEERHLGHFMEPVSARFKSPQVADLASLRQLVARQFFKDVWVRVFPAELELHEKSAQVVEISGKFVLARSEAQALRDLAKDSVVRCFRVEALAEQEPDGEWRFVSADFEELDPKLLLKGTP